MSPALILLVVVGGLWLLSRKTVAAGGAEEECIPSPPPKRDCTPGVDEGCTANPYDPVSPCITVYPPPPGCITTAPPARKRPCPPGTVKVPIACFRAPCPVICKPIGEIPQAGGNKPYQPSPGAAGGGSSPVYCTPPPSDAVLQTKEAVKKAIASVKPVPAGAVGSSLTGKNAPICPPGQTYNPYRKACEPNLPPRKPQPIQPCVTCLPEPTDTGEAPVIPGGGNRVPGITPPTTRVPTAPPPVTTKTAACPDPAAYVNKPAVATARMREILIGAGVSAAAVEASIRENQPLGYSQMFTSPCGTISVVLSQKNAGISYWTIRAWNPTASKVPTPVPSSCPSAAALNLLKQRAQQRPSGDITAALVGAGFSSTVQLSIASIRSGGTWTGSSVCAVAVVLRHATSPFPYPVYSITSLTPRAV